MATLTEIRQWIAKEAGPFDVFTCNASGHTTTKAYIDAIASSIEQDELFRDSWFFLPSAAAYEIQTITESGSPTAGTFIVNWNGLSTSALAFDVSAAAMQTALRLLAGLASVTVSRTGTTTNFVWTINFINAGTNPPAMTISDSTTGGTHALAVATITTVNDSNDKLRVVDTYEPGTGAAASGYILVDRPFSSLGVPNSASVEIHGAINPLTVMPDLINAALRECFVIKEFTLTPTTDYQRHSLASAASWLSNPAWVRQVGYLTSSENRNETDPYEGRTVHGHAEKDGNTVYLVHPGVTFSDTDVIYVKAIKPMYRECRATGGTFGEQSGLSAETDEAPISLEALPWVASMALLIATRRDRGIGGPRGGNKDQLLLRQMEFAQLFTGYTQENLKLIPLTFVPGSKTWGPQPLISANRVVVR